MQNSGPPTNKEPYMQYDYSFFREHCARNRKLKTFTGVDFDTAVSDVFGYPIENQGVRIEPLPLLDPNDDPHVVVHCKGGYIKGPPSSLDALQHTLKAELPRDFVQFYEEFGETLLITRGSALRFFEESYMVKEFLDDDPDVEEDEGVFFRFAHYPSETRLYYGLRKARSADSWHVAWGDYGLLYDEMIGSAGEEYKVMDSFYDWLKLIVETDGFQTLMPIWNDSYNIPVDE